MGNTLGSTPQTSSTTQNNIPNPIIPPHDEIYCPDLYRLIYTPSLTPTNQSLLQHYQFGVTTPPSNIIIPNGYSLIDLTTKRANHEFDDQLLDYNYTIDLFPTPHSNPNSNCNTINFCVGTMYINLFPSKRTIINALSTHTQLQQPEPIPQSITRYHLNNYFNHIQQLPPAIDLTSIIKKKNRYNNIVPNATYRVPLSLQNHSIQLILSKYQQEQIDLQNKMNNNIQYNSSSLPTIPSNQSTPDIITHNDTITNNNILNSQSQQSPLPTSSTIISNPPTTSTITTNTTHTASLSTDSDNTIISDYINASDIIPIIPYVQQTYIATQAPLRSTIADIWTLIWEQHIEYHVILTNITEVKYGRHNEKLVPFWPLYPGLESTLLPIPDFNDMSIDMIPETQVGYYMYIPYQSNHISTSSKSSTSTTSSIISSTISSSKQQSNIIHLPISTTTNTDGTTMSDDSNISHYTTNVTNNNNNNNSIQQSHQQQQQQQQLPTENGFNTHNSILITTTHIEKISSCNATLRIFELKHNNIIRSFSVLHYHDWPDFGVPNMDQFHTFYNIYSKFITNTLLSSLSSISTSSSTPISSSTTLTTTTPSMTTTSMTDEPQQQLINSSPSTEQLQTFVSPILISCSASVGRTGTFSAIIIMIEYLQKFIQHYYINNKPTNHQQCDIGLIPTDSNQHNKHDGNIQQYQYDEYQPNATYIISTIVGLRLNRPEMIQTTEQYQFVYTYLHYWYIHYMNDLFQSTTKQ